jgi:glucan phosphoethanolaminetransferase (alkaline phosphatase superfamily)
MKNAGLFSPAHRFASTVAKSMKSSPWAWMGLLLALIWASEILAIQIWAFGADLGALHWGWMYRHVLRFLFVFSFCLTLILILPRPLLVVALLLDCAVSIALITYQTYFGHTLSLVTVISQAGEGLAVGGFAVELIPRFALVALLCCLGLKLAVCWKSPARSLELMFRRPRYQLLIATVGAWMFAVAMMVVVDNPCHSVRRLPFDRIARTYTYAGAWLVEVAFKDSRWMHEQLVAASQRGGSDRLSDLPHPFPFDGHVVIIQVESLDDAVLSHRVRGELVTPFLRKLREKSLYLPIRAVHYNGSCDADFTILTGFAPPHGFMPYALDRFPIQNTIVDAFHQAGYRTVAIHGNTGEYFRRRNSFAQMGFDELLFSQELVQNYGLQVASHSAHLKDADVLRVAAEQLQHSRRPTMQFLITITSHGPFRELEAKEQELFPEPTGLAENYLNSIRYVDRELEQFYDHLPVGTCLVIYGDHCSKAGYSEEVHPEGAELVPFIVAKKEDTQSGPSTLPAFDSEKLREVSTVDCSNYVRGCLQAIGENKPSPNRTVASRR